MQLQKGETFTDTSPGKTVTSTRLNAHVDNAILLKGAVSEQTELTATAVDDCALVSDTSDSSGSLPKKVQLSNLLPETVRQGVPQYAAGTLSGGVYAITLAPAASAYTAGMVVRFKADSANAGAVDVNVNAIGAKDLLTRAGGELAANDILSNQIVTIVYDGTSFLVLEAISASEVTAAHLNEAARQAVHQYAAGALAAGVYAVTLTPAATAYTAGMVVRFKADNPNTGAVDLAVNGLAAKNLYTLSGAELSANAILAGMVVTAIYDGTNFQVATLAGQQFASAEQALSAGVAVVADIAHGLGALPTRTRWVLVCKSAEFGFSIGDEVDVAGTDSNQIPCFTWGASATNVFLAQRGVIHLGRRDTAATGSLTAASWKAKCYASL